MGYKVRAAQAMMQAMKLKVVVCPSESFGGWRDANAKCVQCGREVYRMPLCEGADAVCVGCADGRL